MSSRKLCWRPYFPLACNTWGLQSLVPQPRLSFDHILLWLPFLTLLFHDDFFVNPPLLVLSITFYCYNLVLITPPLSTGRATPQGLRSFIVWHKALVICLHSNILFDVSVFTLSPFLHARHSYSTFLAFLSFVHPKMCDWLIIHKHILFICIHFPSPFLTHFPGFPHRYVQRLCI